MDTNSPACNGRLKSGIVWLNCFYFSLFVGIIAVPLIALRNSSLLESIWLPCILGFVGVILLTIWFSTTAVDAPTVKGWSRYSTEFGVAVGAIATITLVSFFVPQTEHFWGGYDDFSAYEPKILKLWCTTFDGHNGRPFLGWSYVFGRWLGGGRIEGFIALAVIICFANATLLYAYLRELLPNARALALSCALLYIVNRADPLKFYPLWAANPYGLAVGFLLFSMWLFHVSWLRQHRGFLLMSCASLGVSLFMYEVGYLLAVLPILLLWRDRKRNTTFLFWAYGWITTLLLFATRLTIFQLTNRDSYQLTQASQLNLSPEMIFRNVISHIKPIELFFKVSDAIAPYAILALAIAFIVGLAVWIVGRHDTRPALRVMFLTQVASAFAILLAVAPYSHIVGSERTQFFAAPAQAVFVMFTLGLVGYYLPRFVAMPLLSLVVGLLAANATVESYRVQNLYHHVSFDKTVHVCNQIRALTSKFTGDELVILLHEDPSPLGVSYGIFSGSPLWTGTRIVTIGESPAPYMQMDFEDRSVMVNFSDKPFRRYTYDQVVIFRLDRDGTLYFASEWPTDSRLPKEVIGYAPTRMLKPGKIDQSSDFAFPVWSGPPGDIVSQRDGVLLGRGWSSLQAEDGLLIRNAKQDAEIIVNGQGESQIDLAIEIGPIFEASGVSKIEVLDSQGTVVAKFECAKRSATHLKLPCSQDQVDVFRIRSVSDDPPGSNRGDIFKAYCSRKPFSENDLPPAVADISGGGLKLGSGWYSRETYGGQTFRWLESNGKIITGPCLPGATPGLLIEAATGPGMDGQPCIVELYDESNMLLASRTIVAKETFIIKLPEDSQNTELTLRVVGGGNRIPTDPRILNLMVTKCEWQSKVLESPDIHAENIELGTGWYPYEHFNGEHFRWFNTDSEVIVRSKSALAHSTLVLDAAPGPGLNGNSGLIELIRRDGTIESTAELNERKQLIFQLKDLLAGRNVFQLRVVGGGATIPNDPRILNVQVFHCNWLKDPSGNGPNQSGASH